MSSKSYPFIFLFISLLLSVPGTAAAQTGTIDKLKKDIESEELADTTRINKLNELSEKLIRTGSLNESRLYIMKAIQLSNSSAFKKGFLNALTNLTDLHLHQQKPDSAMIAIREALSLASAPEERVRFLNLEATAFRMSGQLLPALDTYNRALQLADSLSDQRAQMGIQLNMATVYKSLGDFTSAYEAYFNGLKHAETTGDTVRLAIIHNNIGDTYNSEEKYEEAKYHLERSENLSYQADLKSNLVRVYLNLGNTHSNLQNYELAGNYYNVAEELFREIGDVSGKARVNYNRGLMMLDKGNISDARSNLLTAYEESKRLGIKEGLFYSSFSLGNLETDQSNFNKAGEWYDLAVSTAEEMQSGTFLTQAYEKMYELAKKRGSSDALKWLESYVQLTDSLKSDERERIKAEVEAKFEIERREQENEILNAVQSQQQAQLRYQKMIIIASAGGFILILIITFFLYRSNKIRKRTNSELQLKNKQLKRLNSTIQDQNKELESLDHVKNKLFAIIAHDLRGPLSSLQSLLYLIREHDLSKDELDEITHSLEASLQENAATMDNLLAWAKAQMSGIVLNSRNFRLSENIKAVFSQLQFQANQKGIKLKMDVDQKLSVDADYDMVKLIVRNLVVNAIKFSRKGDIVTISTNRREKFVEVCVADQGVGIPEDDKPKIFSSTTHTLRGTSNEKGSGLGLNLCKEFVEEHGGKIWFESEVDKGTTFCFTIPAAEVSEPQPA